MSFVAEQKAFVSQSFEKLHRFGWAMNIWSRLVTAEMNKSSLSWGTKTIQFANSCRHPNVPWTARILGT